MIDVAFLARYEEETPVGKKKKIALIVVGVILALIVAGVAYFMATQQETVKAIQVAVTTTTADIDVMVVEQNEKISSIVSQFPEELNITQEGIDLAVQAEKDVQQQQSTSSDASASTSTDTSTTTDTETTSTVTESTEALTATQLAAIEVTELTAELYMQKDYYIGLLDELEQQGRADVKALTAGEQKGEKLFKLATQYMAAASKLETEADSVVNGIISEIKAILQQYGGDTTLCDEIYQAYVDEKTLKKAQYMSKYADYLM